ncbi:NAD-dependent epimerase/dehydratase family protein [Taklimakanibacter lacteus]|uniref:NAD-dependent epimerase/dehydratase family protein n=1 Tax=Taklimakanibacter lacteus TaxID=2268456 RepID=UPI000E6748CE
MKGPIAVTGSTGFVGRHIVKALDEAGFALRLLVRAGPRDCGFGSAETIIGGLDDEAALKQLVEGASAVIHLAGAIAAPDRATFFAVNAQGSENVAKAALTAGVERFIHVSSLAAREPQLSDYGASKRAAEDALAALGPKGLITVRPPVIYGPGDRATLPLLGQLTRRMAVIPGSRRARFSLLYVEDLAKFILARLADDAQGVCEIDDGRPRGYGWPDLLDLAATVEGRRARPVFLPQWLLEGLAWPASLLGSALNLRVPLTPGKVRELYHPDWVVSGRAPSHPHCLPFAEGFRLTIAWYREQGWLPARDGADTRRQSTKLYGENSK